MKKYFLIFIFTLIFIPNLFNSSLSAQTNEQILEESNGSLIESFPEVINSFKSIIVVNTDNSIDITETIVYDFKDLEKHGIYRTIPLTKVVGSTHKLKITNITVSDENGKYYSFLDTGDGGINLRIGDADKLITGLHTYIIKYKAINPIGYFDKYDEIYWNATGNEWQVPIWNAEAHVFLPGNLNATDLQIASYCGFAGATDPCVNGLPTYNSQNNQTEVIFQTPKNFYYDTGEGMTVAVGFPKGIVAPSVLQWYKKAITYIYIAYGLGLIYILLFLRLIFIKFLPEYHKRKRPIVAEFEAPKDILPSQAGLIYNLFGLGNSKILTADILHLASLGYIKIENKPVDKDNKKKSFKMRPEFMVLIPFILMMSMVISAVSSLSFFVVVIILFILLLIGNKNKVKNLIESIKNPTEFSITRTNNDINNEVPENLKLLYNLISKQNETVTLSDIEEEKKYNSFQNYIIQTKKSIKEKTIEVKKKNKIIKIILKSLLRIITVVLFFAFIVAILIFIDTVENIPIQAFVALGILIVGFILYKITKSIFNWRLSKMTDNWYSVAGLHRYIKIAEKDRIQFESDPTKAEQIFSLLLPYAVAFGLEGKWIKVFDGIMVNPPDYYSGGSIHTMSSSIGVFAGAMASTSNAGAPVSSSSGSSSFGGSSGGGSSGGGGGGGGGGSW